MPFRRSKTSVANAVAEAPRFAWSDVRSATVHTAQAAIDTAVDVQAAARAARRAAEAHEALCELVFKLLTAAMVGVAIGVVVSAGRDLLAALGEP